VISPTVRSQCMPARADGFALEIGGHRQHASESSVPVAIAQLQLHFAHAFIDQEEAPASFVTSKRDPCLNLVCRCQIVAQLGLHVHLDRLAHPCLSEVCHSFHIARFLNRYLPDGTRTLWIGFNPHQSATDLACVRSSRNTCRSRSRHNHFSSSSKRVIVTSDHPSLITVRARSTRPDAPCIRISRSSSASTSTESVNFSPSFWWRQWDKGKIDWRASGDASRV
jgi:hypothetical protein